MPLDLFSPIGATVTLSATTSAGPATLTSAGTAPITKSVRVYNAGASTVFIAFGDSTVAATTASMPIPSGGIETFELGSSVTTVSGITAAGTATVYFTTGRGA